MRARNRIFLVGLCHDVFADRKRAGKSQSQHNDCGTREDTCSIAHGSSPSLKKDSDARYQPYKQRQSSFANHTDHGPNVARQAPSDADLDCALSHTLKERVGETRSLSAVLRGPYLNSDFSSCVNFRQFLSRRPPARPSYLDRCRQQWSFSHTFPRGRSAATRRINSGREYFARPRHALFRTSCRHRAASALRTKIP